MLGVAQNIIGAPIMAIGSALGSVMGTLQNTITYGLVAAAFNFGVIPLMERNGAEETAAAFKKALGVEGTTPNWHSVLKTMVAAMGLDFTVRTASNMYEGINEAAAQQESAEAGALSAVGQVAAIGGTAVLVGVGLKAAGVGVDWKNIGDSVKENVITPARELGKDLGKALS